MSFREFREDARRQETVASRLELGVAAVASSAGIPRV
jgi:hypothetical protein